MQFPFTALQTFINQEWDSDILPILMQYIKIPAKSPHFDRNWEKNQFIEQALQLIATWCKKQPIVGLSLEILRLPHRTPLLFIEIEGKLSETILLYGHLDKQPEMTGWDQDLNPWKPVLKGEKLYGRGGADDGYAIFSALCAIRALQTHEIPHARCIVIIECCEESGSYDLPFYLDGLKKQIASPSLVIGLDGGCGNYTHLWNNTSLRGLIGGQLTIEVLKEGIHSGLGSGVIPSPVLILRELLNRIENLQGEILLPECYVDIPSERVRQTKETAQRLGDSFLESFPFLPGVKPLVSDPTTLLLNQTWHPELSIIGIDGLPSQADAGNVTIPKLAVSLSLRLPPTANPQRITIALKNTLENSPPFGAQVHFEVNSVTEGWNAPAETPWFAKTLQEASQGVFGGPALGMGQGGTIPFMGMLHKAYPDAQFLITGILGPHSNAHGPNEFLHLRAVKKLTTCVAFVVASHYVHFSNP